MADRGRRLNVGSRPAPLLAISGDLTKLQP